MIRYRQPTLLDVYYPSGWERSLMEQRLLTEGIFKDTLSDVAQAALSSGAIAVSGGAAGDTVVDVVFATKIAKDVLEECLSIIEGAGDLAGIILEAASLNFAGNHDGFYKQINNLVRRTAANKFAGNKAKEYIKKASEKIREVIDRMVRAVGKWLQTLIPDDFGLAGPAFQAVMGKILSAATNPYKMATAAVDALPGNSGQLLTDPAALKEFLNNIATSLIKGTDELMEMWDVDANAEPDRLGQLWSVLKSNATLYPNAVMYPGKWLAARGADALGAEGLSDAIDDSQFQQQKEAAMQLLPDVKGFLTKFQEDWIPITVDVIRKLISWMFGGIALFQILSDEKEVAKLMKIKTQKSAWDKGETETQKELDFGNIDLDLGPKDLAAHRYLNDEFLIQEKNTMKITARQLRRIIREAEGSTKKYDDDSALRGDQSKLPDGLQKGIIDKTVEDREEREEEEREEKNESLRITRRQLRRIIKEAIGSNNIDLYLDLGPDGDFPIMTDSESEKQWEVPYFTSAADFLDEVLSQLPGSTPDTIVYGEEMDLPDLPLSQVWDAVMAAGRRR